METVLLLVGLLAMLLIGIDIAFVLAGLGVLLLIAGGFSPLMIPQALMSSMDSFLLLAVPLLGLRRR